MFKSLCAVAVLFAMFLAPVVGARKLDSVQAIQSNGQTFCTVFSINEKHGYFASAGHCAFAILENDMNEVTILGTPATIERISPVYDVAVFKSDVHIPALKLAKKSVKVCNVKKAKRCEVIAIQGFPYGLPKLVTVTGHVAGLQIPINHPTYNTVMYSDVLDITTAGGNSGSPVTNAHGEVIGILWGGFRGSNHSLSIPLESIRQALQGYLE